MEEAAAHVPVPLNNTQQIYDGIFWRLSPIPVLAVSHESSFIHSFVVAAAAAVVVFFFFQISKCSTMLVKQSSVTGSVHGIL